MLRGNIATYKIWAPENSVWAQWAKPVLFMREPYYDAKYDFQEQNTEWVPPADGQTIIISDLPGAKGVEDAINLASIGYRPVPLYNGVYSTIGTNMIVPVEDIVNALYLGADKLIEYNIKSNAPPVFILDSDRMKCDFKEPGKYDNRWCVFPQDMPSASFLKSNNINSVFIHSDRIKNDLAHILYRYSKSGIKIYHYRDKQKPREVSIVKPSGFRSLFYRFKVTFKLTRNPAGGFGGQIPEPVEGSTFGYYGIG
jgi:hypothetical protein